MSSLKEIIKAFCRCEKKKINWLSSNADEVKAKVVYNSALNDVISFIDRYEKGKVEQEHVQHLLKNYGNKE